MVRDLHAQRTLGRPLETTALGSGGNVYRQNGRLKERETLSMEELHGPRKTVGTKYIIKKLA